MPHISEHDLPQMWPVYGAIRTVIVTMLLVIWIFYNRQFAFGNIAVTCLVRMKNVTEISHFASLIGFCQIKHQIK